MLSRPYPKIETLYERGEDFKVKVGEFKRPVYSQISKWLITEKVDGTNIRLHFYRVNLDDVDYEIGGRTDNAQTPKPLEFALRELCERIKFNAKGILHEYELGSLTLYGEGYGPKIQKSGHLLAQEPKFILFDVMADDVFLNEQAVTDTARRLEIDRVPILGYWPLDEAVSYVSGGFFSSVAKRNTGGHVQAEGLVGKTLEPLYDSRRNRLVVKLKTKDFK